MQYSQPSLRTVQVIRYVTPLREGGSLPAIAEADDEFLYVLKFRGAGQGVKALIAELIGGEIARTLGLRVPELVFANLDAAFGRSEPDEEIQDLLKASVGLNLGLHYLSGSITYDPAVMAIDPLLASQIVWLDCLLTNVDRTARNTNMLIWNKELWLIDHGAALYFHHSWDNWKEQAPKPFTLVKDHVLLRWASQLEAVEAVFRPLLTPERIRDIVDLIPDEWLIQAAAGLDGGFNASGAGVSAEGPAVPPPGLAAERRAVYLQFLNTRIAASHIFVKEAQHVREAFI